MSDKTTTRRSRRNEQLHAAMRAAGLDASGLAAVVGRHYKSAQRWVYEGRVPSRVTRERVGRALGVPAAALWPDHLPTVPADLVRMYVDVREIPDRVWTDLIGHAGEVTIVCDEFPSLAIVPALTSRTFAVPPPPIRLCFGPAAPLIRIPGSCVEYRRARQETLSFFAFGPQLLVWLNCGGPSMARLGPVMHLRRVDDNGLYDAYAHVLSQIWRDAADPARPW